MCGSVGRLNPTEGIGVSKPLQVFLIHRRLQTGSEQKSDRVHDAPSHRNLLMRWNTASIEMGPPFSRYQKWQRWHQLFAKSPSSEALLPLTEEAPHEGDSRRLSQ